jgi:hypothetical protein
MQWVMSASGAIGRYALRVYSSDAAYEAGLTLAAVLIVLTILVSVAPRQALPQPLDAGELPNMCWQVDYAC